MIIIVYSTIVTVCVAGLIIAASVLDEHFDPAYDAIALTLCGVFWPICVSIAIGFCLQGGM